LASASRSAARSSSALRSLPSPRPTPETGKPIDRLKLLKRFKAALGRADVRAVRFHDLRHTFGTRMAAQGMPMRVLQELMGHRDFKTTLIYADYAPSEREAEWVEEAFRPAASVVVDSPVTTWPLRHGGEVALDLAVDRALETDEQLLVEHGSDLPQRLEVGRVRSALEARDRRV
jgi:hypothetical protein